MINLKSRKLFSDKETVVWCIGIALAGFSIIALYMAATNKTQIDSDVQEAHYIESDAGQDKR